MNCRHENQQPTHRRVIDGVERVVFTCQDCAAELIYEEPASEMTKQDFDQLSTDEILDHMAARKLRILVEFRQPLRGGPPQWVVRFGQSELVTDPDRRRAIVLGALKACEVAVEA